MYKIKKSFTLVELLVSMFIIAILSGLILPTFTRSREKAKYTRWLTYNVGFNRDSDTVINFNFEDAPYRMTKDDVTTEMIKNHAVVCDAEEFDSRDYYGIMKNSPEWVKGGGRWPFKNAVQFDGNNDYIEIINNSIIDFDPTEDAFTIITWAVFYSLSNQCLCSKGEELNKLQYGYYISKNRPAASVGESTREWEAPVLETMRWYQMVLVNDPAEGYKIYIDGKLAQETKSTSSNVKSIKMPDLKLVLGALLEPSDEDDDEGKGKGKEKGKGKGLDKKGNDDDSDGSPRECFRGRIDEFILLKRALSESEIKRNYLVGNPY